MEWLHQWLWHGGNFLGIEWHVWKVIGWLGNVAFTSRFIVQWYATEKRKEVVVPLAFWWLSLAGSWLLLSYALFYQRDSVFIFANLFNWIPYLRNLIIQRRHQKAHMECSSCRKLNPPQAKHCMECGRRLPGQLVPESSRDGGSNAVKGA
ncbi:MAG: lipid-A-disaccharide synthase N-terminal domain-containing protein [Verrucomicrobia bacterium]|nr:lipid-A-disaccharide synthase N-terminal domain-containing protein [Verrucomicrobiota bacterium]